MNPAAAKLAGTMFSIIVKRKLSTKHFGSQWPSRLFSPSEVIAALQPLMRWPSLKAQKTRARIVFSKLNDRPTRTVARGRDGLFIRWLCG
jgi:hypothetical protein